MKVLYIDCGMGAAGDMLTAALLEITCPVEGASAGARIDSMKTQEFVSRFNGIGIPGVEMQAFQDVRKGVEGTRVRIFVHGEEESAPEESDHHDTGNVHDHSHYHDHEHSHDHEHGHHHHHEHHHRTLGDIENLISSLAIDEDVKNDAISVYRLIAEAESKVHGEDVGEVHFHEVGALDAVADVTAVCMLMNEIKPDEIIASPMATGYGMVKCAHGLLPVPAPATALLLEGIPSYAGDVKGELCTPTGAALIRHFADRFAEIPLMTNEVAGYGLGTKDFEKANCLRALYGECFSE